MSKPAIRACSRYGRESVELLGRAVRTARIERRMTISELAERAGASRGLVHRIERGDTGCSIGAAFEIATIVGLRLFDAEPDVLARRLDAARDRLTLLPKAARRTPRAVNDDF